jgi:hypothetical protein
VKASYEVKGGQKLVTFLLVEAAHPFGAPDGVNGCC